MRLALACIGLLVLLLGPADERLHQHPLGNSDADCLACQSNQNPAESVDVTLPRVHTPLVAVHTPFQAADPGIVEDRLYCAPKTSPPAPLT